MKIRKPKRGYRGRNNFRLAELQDYPGHEITIGEKDRAIVELIQRRLNAVGCDVQVTGTYAATTRDAVKLYQSRSADTHGVPLRVDGIVGPITWAALFGPDTVPTTPPPSSPLISEALVIASSQIGVKEQPLGSNRGPQVDQYLESVGLNPEEGSFPWCAAFLYWCFDHADL